MTSDGVAVEEVEDKIDRRVIQLRAYVKAGAKKGGGQRRLHAWSSGISIIFDTETFTDPSQRLRFGAYQIREHGKLIELGLFHPDDVDADDLASLRLAMDELPRQTEGVALSLVSRAEFVEQAIFKWGLEVRGLIVGFNLPFDISRISTSHTYAKRSMKGGFSFTLAERRPAIRVKHLSQRAAFINFAGKTDFDHDPDRGFFVDVKTLAASLTGQSHSLESLTKLLGTTPKSPLDDYGGPITTEMVAYCLNDVQATWECFDALAARYAGLGLSRTGLHDLYSEASLGKAYLGHMSIKPWMETQPDFPPELIGQILSTYYGGRAEVHIRREITPVIHCDFLSMYPTVCTLMGLWGFVTAEGMAWRDATDEVRDFVEACDLATLQDPATWRQLHCIVQVQPEGDVFPVRAEYDAGEPATIGVNHLTSREPLWFTLADVLASKLLGGKVPKIISAIWFDAGDPQRGLTPIELAGVEVRPGRDDFYKLLIDQRRRIQKKESAAAGSEKAGLNAQQQGLKILANSTSYGIFVELNVQSLERAKDVECYDHLGVGRTIRTSKIEEPGRYFHPLLGTLITGAARLMLACAERNVLDQGLDWAFCDTDSLAIANANGLATPEFIARVETVLDWFKPLNPYEEKGSILQLEKVNFPLGHANKREALRPTNVLAISAKRYALFDLDSEGKPDLRKGSRHGLGHFMPPYRDPDRERVARLGVELWQADFWREIILAYDTGKPDEPQLENLAGLLGAAPTRYAVTNQTLLTWFKSYNATVPARDQVWPFNFLLTYQPKSAPEMMASDATAGTSPRGRRPPAPASRYSSDLAKDRPEVFDRRTGEPVPWEHLRSYRRALGQYHLHSELKFRGGEWSDRGTLTRRHVEPAWVIPIGKESDNLEAREVLGENEDHIKWSPRDEARQRLARELLEQIGAYRISDRMLEPEARVSHHTLAEFRQGRPVQPSSLLRIGEAVGRLRKVAVRDESEAARWLKVARELKGTLGGRNKLAKTLDVSGPYMGRVLRGEKPMTAELIGRIKRLVDVEGGQPV
jgi:hypothetical protein